MHRHLSEFLRSRPELFPFRGELHIQQFAAENLGPAAERFPVPSRLPLSGEEDSGSYGFALLRAPALEDLGTRLERWLDAELTTRTSRQAAPTRVDDLLQAYATQVTKVAANARESSILADYDSVFWLVHTQQVAQRLTAVTRRVIDANVAREEAERLKYELRAKWASTVLPSAENDRFLQLVRANPLLSAEEFIGPELREMRGYVTAVARRDYGAFRRSFDSVRAQAARLFESDKLLRRAIGLLGYPDLPPQTLTLLDRRVQVLLSNHPSFETPPEQSLLEALSPRLIEMFIVQALRRAVVWMAVGPDGDHVADGDRTRVYSRGTRPMDFGRRGVVEPVVHRYGLVYDINSFTEVLTDSARGGKSEEQASYRQMLEFQRDLAAIADRYRLQFEKFLGDGAFYTSRRAIRTLEAAVAIQQFYAAARARGFAFNRGMRIAVNYGYYRILPMQVSADGTQIMEFYGPGIVELSRLTTGKTTKEIEDIQHLLISHGYDQHDVYRFFDPLSRSVRRDDLVGKQRDFYVYVNENGHLVNEGIVVSIPFIRQLSSELSQEGQRIYRAEAPWGTYAGFPSSDGAAYIALRMLGSVSLKGIGSYEVAEAVRLTAADAEVSVAGDQNPLLNVLERERNRSTADAASQADAIVGSGDLVVCAQKGSHGGAAVILVGEWDPLAAEVRRPIRLDFMEAERYGLAVPLTMESVQSQTVAYQKLYRTLSQLETLPSFPVDAIRGNANFHGFIIAGSVEPL